MGCWNSKDVRIKSKPTEKNTAEEMPNKIKFSDQKFEDDENSSIKDGVESIFDVPSFVKSFKTQEFFYPDNDKELKNAMVLASTKVKRWKSIQSRSHEDLKRPSEWKQFLIQELNNEQIR